MALTSTMLLMIIDRESLITSNKNQAIIRSKITKSNFRLFNDSDNMFNVQRTIKQNMITQININYTHHLSELSSIPKILHIAWSNKNVLDSKTKIIKFGIKNFIKINPIWNVLIHDDDEIEQYIKTKISLFDYQLIQNKHIIEKVDLWRLLIIYFEGGMYADIDRLFNVNMDQLIGNEIKMLLPTHYDINFSQDLMCSAPLNVLFKLAIELNLSKRRILEWNDNQHNISEFERILELGPQTFWEAATKTLFGILIKDGGDYPDENEIIVAKMRDVIRECALIEIYREIWCDTIVFHAENMTECRAIDKGDLWAETDDKLHWEQDLGPK